jgi:hypothetical protein
MDHRSDTKRSEAERLEADREDLKVLEGAEKDLPAKVGRNKK